MENIYAIYSYKLVEHNDEGDWTQGDQVKEPDLGSAQDTLYDMFEKRQNMDFRVQKEVSGGAKKYVCKIYGNDRRIVALRLHNEHEQPVWKLVEVPNDPMGKMEKKAELSIPCTYVIIDCRPGHNIIAVKVETSAWRNTDTVRDLIEDSFNLNLESLSAGFRVQLFTKMDSIDFLNDSRYRIKKEKRKLKSVTINFKTGKIDPKIEAFIKNSDFLNRLFNVIDKYSPSGEITLNQPNGDRMVDRRRHDLENLVTLVSSDPLGYALDATFDDGVTYHCGKDVRKELPMNPKGALELFHLGRRGEPDKELNLDFYNLNSQGADSNRYLLEKWLDDVAEETKRMKDARTVRRKKGRAAKRKTA